MARAAWRIVSHPPSDLIRRRNKVRLEAIELPVITSQRVAKCIISHSIQANSGGNGASDTFVGACDLRDELLRKFSRPWWFMPFLWEHRPLTGLEQRFEGPLFVIFFHQNVVGVESRHRKDGNIRLR